MREEDFRQLETEKIIPLTSDKDAPTCRIDITVDELNDTGTVAGKINRTIAEAAFGGMEAGAVQQVIAQYAQCEPSREVHVERFGHELVGSYFVLVHASSPSFAALVLRYLASRSSKYSFTRSK